jgi:hypothetical protein
MYSPEKISKVAKVSVYIDLLDICLMKPCRILVVMLVRTPQYFCSKVINHLPFENGALAIILTKTYLIPPLRIINIDPNGDRDLDIRVPPRRKAAKLGDPTPVRDRLFKTSAQGNKIMEKAE